jgi:hypothetical protein
MYTSNRYLPLSSSLFSQDQAVSEMFSRAYARGQLLKIWSFLTGKSRSLFSIEIIDRGSIKNIHEKIGIQIVSIDQIRGSEGRVQDFDRDFNPLVNCIRDRWLGVASALRHGRRLPAVSLVQVGDLFFVRDGHHRISVAIALGETVIEARVIVWQVNGLLPWEVTPIPSTLSPMDRIKDLQRIYQSLQRVWNKLSQYFMPRVCNSSSI